jgi:hypothetical protein
MAPTKRLEQARNRRQAALVKHLDDISADTNTELNIPTGVPLVYELDENLKPIPHKDAIAPLKRDDSWAIWNQTKCVYNTAIPVVAVVVSTLLGLLITCSLGWAYFWFAIYCGKL